MKRQITIALIIMAILLTIIAFSGCAGYRGYALVREKSTDRVSVKDKGLFKKEPIFGKGIDFWSNKPMIIKMSRDKDGNITYEYSSQKTSVWEKIFGTWKMIKPNSVDIGGK